MNSSADKSFRQPALLLYRVLSAVCHVAGYAIIIVRAPARDHYFYRLPVLPEQSWGSVEATYESGGLGACHDSTAEAVNGEHGAGVLHTIVGLPCRGVADVTRTSPLSGGLFAEMSAGPSFWSSLDDAIGCHRAG